MMTLVRLARNNVFCDLTFSQILQFYYALSDLSLYCEHHSANWHESIEELLWTGTFGTLGIYLRLLIAGVTYADNCRNVDSYIHIWILRSTFYKKREKERVFLI